MSPAEMRKTAQLSPAQIIDPNFGEVCCTAKAN
jgi:hypothetical protein